MGRLQKVRSATSASSILSGLLNNSTLANCWLVRGFPCFQNMTKDKYKYLVEIFEPRSAVMVTALPATGQFLPRSLLFSQTSSHNLANLHRWGSS